MSHVDVLRGRRTHWVWCQVPCPLDIPKNRHARRTETRKNRTPHVPDKYRLLDVISQCYILSFSGRECDALLSPRKPAHTHSHTSQPHRKLTSSQWPCWHSPRQQTLPAQSPLPFCNIMPKSPEKKLTLMYQSLYSNAPLSACSRTSRPLSPHSQYPLVFGSQATSSTPPTREKTNHHGLVLVEFLELRTSRKWVIPARINTKPRRGVFSESLLRNRQKYQHPNPSKTATSIPPPLAQVVDRDKAVQVFTGLIVSTLNSHCNIIIHMNYCYYGH